MAATLITNQEFRSRTVLTGLEFEDEQFRISSNATVRARVKSSDGLTAYTAWVTLTHNANRDDDWGLSTLDVIIPDSETASVTASQGSAKLDVNISGFYVDVDGVDTADAYDKTWTEKINVEKGLA